MKPTNKALERRIKWMAKNKDNPKKANKYCPDCGYTKPIYDPDKPDNGWAVNIVKSQKTGSKLRELCIPCFNAKLLRSKDDREKESNTNKILSQVKKCELCDTYNRNERTECHMCGHDVFIKKVSK